jgi:glucose-1-phosphate thymidylyltransferase
MRMRPIDIAVLLAAGRGTRMQATDGTVLDAAQSAAAAAGSKPLMPVAGRRPFLDYSLSSLADAGFSEVCIVVSARDEAIRRRYEHEVVPRRVRLRFAEQAEPAGTANALLAVEEIAGESEFLVLNADNYYPVDGLRLLRETNEPATLAFSRAGLLRDGQIASERLARYALLDIGADGYLVDIIEKPDAATMTMRASSAISMNVWRFDSTIFRACRAVRPSSRGELELPLAVRLAVREMGMRIRAWPIDAGVLDLSHRTDVPAVTERLRAAGVSI